MSFEIKQFPREKMHVLFYQYVEVPLTTMYVHIDGVPRRLLTSRPQYVSF